MQKPLKETDNMRKMEEQKLMRSASKEQKKVLNALKGKIMDAPENIV